MSGQSREFHGQTSNTSDGSGSLGSWKGRFDKEEKASEKQDPQNDVLNGNVLMVDQLWLWAIGSSEYAFREYVDDNADEISNFAFILP